MTQRRSQAPSQISSQNTSRFAKFSCTTSHEYSEENPELSKKADETVQYILFCCLSEHKSIVKRSDITKLVLKDFNRQSKEVMVLVKRRLKDVFGMELIDLDGKHEKYGISCKYEYDPELSKLNSNANIDSSAFESSETDHDLLEQFKYSMIMISLAIIFMNENEIEASLFWDTLKRLDINRDEKKHKYLGDIQNFFTQKLVKEGYLEYELVKGMDTPTYKFKSGWRSQLEITKKSILEFVCCVYGGLDVCKPEEWSIQYAEVIKADTNNDLTMEEADNSNNDVEEEETTTQQPARSDIFSQEATQRSQRRR